MDSSNVLTDEERRRLIDSIPQVLNTDAYKENIQPRRKGRSVSALTSLFESSDRESLLQAGHLKFQEQLDNLDEQDDPLQTYINYIDWTIQMYPQGQSIESNLIGLLKDATDQFKNDRRYKFDPRYLKIWMEYTNWVNDPKEIYLFLMKQGIGQTLSLFYEEYAGYYEKHNKYEEAAQVYELGIKENADPIKRLQKNYDSFKARVEERKRKGIIRKQPSAAQVQMNSLRATGQRTMLGHKFDSQSRTSVSANVFAGLNTQSRNRSFGNDIPSPSSSSSDGFSVYVESSSSIRNSILPSSSPHNISSSSLRLENARPIEKMAGSTLLQKQSLIAQPSTERFQVYEDDEDDEDVYEKRINKSSSMLSILSTESESPLSRIRKNPISDEQVKRKRPKVSDAQKQLEKRFKQYQARYLKTTNSKGDKEIITVINYNENQSFEEQRSHKEENDFSSYLRQQREHGSPIPEYTAETLAAMESIGELFTKPVDHNSKEEEEDLTWNNPYQTFKPIYRPPTNENQ